ncbi:MAG: helix-turn-helix transcriptional regulator [Chthoniobacterales bacterium]
MTITGDLTDGSILLEMGNRLSDLRLARNLTQAALAERAGVSKRTVERLESGQVATQMSGFLRVCRALELLERFNDLVPEVLPGPMEQLKNRGHKRQRASGAKSTPDRRGDWTWGDES